MPSNTFRASQLIAHLQTLIAEHGDLDVVLPVQPADRVFAITGRDIRPASTLCGRSLGCLVFAVELAKPLEDYQRSPDGRDGALNFDLSEAPEGVPLSVYLRVGGESTAQRNADRWFVTNERGRLVELAPGGVLGWRALEPGGK